MTPQIRAYLTRLDRETLLVDVVRDLVTAFGLDPQEAGKVLSAWVVESAIKEPYPSPSPAV